MRTSVNEPVPFYAALRRPITAFAHELHDCVLRHAYGAVTSIAPYGGFTRKYMLRFFLRSTLTCSPSTLSTSRARVERSN